MCKIHATTLAILLMMQSISGASIELGKYRFHGDADLTVDEGDLDTPNLNGSAEPGISFSAFSRTGVAHNPTQSSFSSDQWTLAGVSPRSAALAVDGNGLPTDNYVAFGISASKSFVLEQLEFQGKAGQNAPDSLLVTISQGGSLVASELFSTLRPPPVGGIVPRTDYVFDFADLLLTSADAYEFRFHVHGDGQADGDSVAASHGGDWAIDNVVLRGAHVPELSSLAVWAILAGLVVGRRSNGAA